MILILGHPRCGTGYSSSAFKAVGYDIGHESLGKDGTSCWGMAIPGKMTFPKGKFPVGKTSRNDYNWDHIFHCVRDPKTAIISIASVENTRPNSLRYRLEHTNLDRNASEPTRAIQSYIMWNDIIESQRVDLRFQIEDLSEIEEYMKSNGMRWNNNWKSIPNNVNTRRNSEDIKNSYIMISQEQWDSVPNLWKDELYKKCELYGYNSPFTK